MQIRVSNLQFPPKWCEGETPSERAFTLIELLVVIAIIAMLAAIGIPALRGMSKSNSLSAADRQLLDDLAYARQRAISDHTEVDVIFVPPWITNPSLFPVPANDPVTATRTTNLFGGQYTTYAMFSPRTVGDQPGVRHARYLTEWRTLPNGIYIATNKFDPEPPGTFFAPQFHFGSFQFPAATNNYSPPLSLPYIGFNYLGQLVTGQDEYIPLARGSIFYARDPKGAIIPTQPADIQESVKHEAYYRNYNLTVTGQPLPSTPAPDDDSKKSYNLIHIDWLTGRAHVEKIEL